MKSVARVFALAVGMVFLTASVSVQPGEKSGPYKVRLRSSEEKIRAKVLEQTPLGMNQEDVLAFINHRLVHNGKVEVSDSGARRVTYGPDGVDEWIGASGTNRLEVGHYGEWQYLLLIKTYVYLSWAFDAEQRLIEVVVYKETDTL